MSLGPHWMWWIPEGPPPVCIFGWQKGGHLLGRGKTLTIFGSLRGLVSLGAWPGLFEFNVMWILVLKSEKCSDFTKTYFGPLVSIFGLKIYVSA